MTDEEARVKLTEAMDRHMSPMLQLADRLVWSRSEAERLVAESFLAAHASMRAGGPGQNGDLKIVLYGKLLERFPKECHEFSGRTDEGATGRLTGALAGLPRPEARLRRLMAAVGSEELYDVIARLSAGDRLLTLLYYLAEFTQGQIAKLTSLSPAQVGDRLRLSRLKLHEHILAKTHSLETGEAEGPGWCDKFSGGARANELASVASSSQATG